MLHAFTHTTLWPVGPLSNRALRTEPLHWSFPPQTAIPFGCQRLFFPMPFANIFHMIFQDRHAPDQRLSPTVRARSVFDQIQRLTGYAWRRIRWACSKGWPATEFDRRYARQEQDVWAYEQSTTHRRRRELILAVLGEKTFAAVFEAGCAEGFITAALAPRAAMLTACDLAPEAVRRTRKRCAAFNSVSVIEADIRKGFPVSRVNLAVFSDVLYYLSRQEIASVLAEAARCVVPGGWMLFANEWNASYKSLTPPDYVVHLLHTRPEWRQVRLEVVPSAGPTTLTIAVFERT